jgi:hypothetical protein
MNDRAIDNTEYEIQRRIAVANEYKNFMSKFIEVIPCRTCVPTYLLTETGLVKNCEADCKLLKCYNELVSLYQNLLVLREEDKDGSNENHL